LFQRGVLNDCAPAVKDDSPYQRFLLRHDMHRPDGLCFC
jgi:hypothetical protein